MIELKILGIEKAREIIEFDRLCFPTDFWKVEDWQSLLNDERAAYYALVDGEKIVGDVFIYDWQGVYDYVKIMNIAVHADYRGQGLAARMLQHVRDMAVKSAAEHAESNTLCKLCGETRATNIAMQRTFESCGYTLDRVEESYYTNPNESAYKYILEI